MKEFIYFFGELCQFVMCVIGIYVCWKKIFNTWKPQKASQKEPVEIQKMPVYIFHFTDLAGVESFFPAEPNQSLDKACVEFLDFYHTYIGKKKQRPATM